MKAFLHTRETTNLPRGTPTSLSPRPDSGGPQTSLFPYIFTIFAGTSTASHEGWIPTKAPHVISALDPISSASPPPRPPSPSSSSSHLTHRSLQPPFTDIFSPPGPWVSCAVVLNTNREVHIVVASVSIGSPPSGSSEPARKLRGFNPPPPPRVKHPTR